MYHIRNNINFLIPDTNNTWKLIKSSNTYNQKSRKRYIHHLERDTMIK